MQPNQFLQKNYEFFQQWYHWWNKARHLRAHARSLYADAVPDLRRFEKAFKAAKKQLVQCSIVEIKAEEPEITSAFALYGAALENARKGLMISNDGNLIGAHKLSDELKRHDLVRLASDAKIKLSDKEEYLLKWLSEVVVWRGRYPVPTRSHPGFFHPFDHQVTLTAAKERFRMLDGIFDRTKKALPRLPRKRARYGVMLRLDDE